MLIKPKKKLNIADLNVNICLNTIKKNLILSYLFDESLNISEDNFNQEENTCFIFYYEPTACIWIPNLQDIDGLNELELIKRCIKNLSIDQIELAKIGDLVIITELSKQFDKLDASAKSQLQIEFEINYYLNIPNLFSY